MRPNRTGQDLPRDNRQGALQRRLAGLSSAAGGIDPERPGHDALRDEARARLKAGGHNNRRQKVMPGDAEARARSSTTWHLWVVFDILLLLLIVPLVVAVPTVLDCRNKRDQHGFFAGQSFEKCATDGISERWSVLDSRLKTIVRGSGQ